MQSLGRHTISPRGMPLVQYVTEEVVAVTASTLSFEPGFISGFDLLNFCFDI